MTVVAYDNGDGSWTVTGSPITDNGDGTYTFPAYDNGDGTATIDIDLVAGATAATLELYDRLPQVYRDVDATALTDGSSVDYPMLRLLSLLGDPIQPLDDLYARIAYTGPPSTSDLVNPATADVSWFGWLAQLLGVVLTATTPAGQRAQLAGAAGSWQHGTLAAIKALIVAANPGAAIDVRSISAVAGMGNLTPDPGMGAAGGTMGDLNGSSSDQFTMGDPFTIGVYAPPGQPVARTTFAQLKAAFPTIGALSGYGTWADQETYVSIHLPAEAEKPAGFALRSHFVPTP